MAVAGCQPTGPANAMETTQPQIPAPFALDPNASASDRESAAALLARATEELTAPAASAEAPVEIATAADTLVFAWPDWRDDAELERLLDTFARHLVGRTGSCLCLRRDPALDPDARAATEALLTVHARVLGIDAQLDVLLVDDAFGPAQYPSLKRLITCAIALESSASGPRAELFGALGEKVVRTSDTFVTAILQSLPSAQRPQLYSNAVLDTVNWQMVERIQALHPWMYPVVLGNLRVTPGVGSPIPPETLENAMRCRAQLLVEAALRRIEIQGRAVLEVGSNCGFWSAQYARRGATRVTGLDTRELCLRQADLYWRTNRFLPEGAWRFVKGDISDPSALWSVRQHGPFDIVLCAGILHHLHGYCDVLAGCAELAGEAIVLDTRVTDGPEAPERNPNEPFIDARSSESGKVVPNLDALLFTLRELLFEPEVLPVRFDTAPGVDGADDYNAGRRVAIVARRVDRAPA